MSVTKQSFGRTSDGREATLYILENTNGYQAKVTDFGATLVSVMAPDRNGNMLDVVLGYDDAPGYEGGTCYQGAVVGRVANRIANASVTINGVDYALTANNKTNSLHGGRDFYSKRYWTEVDLTDNSVQFELVSPHMDQGYPGEAVIRIRYTLTEENAVELDYYAVADQNTVIAMTNHSYFNLKGYGTTEDHELWLDADTFTDIDERVIPTGELVDVTGTPMDFRTPKLLSKECDADYRPLQLTNGYDHNWVINGEGYRKFASFYCKETGIGFQVFTDMPGVQFYAGNNLKGQAGKGGRPLAFRTGTCFETQFYPDAVHQPAFPSPFLKAGEAYAHKTAYRFYQADEIRI